MAVTHLWCSLQVLLVYKSIDWVVGFESCCHCSGQKSGKGDQQQQQGKSGGGWGLGILNYILPKKKNEAHLPDDKNPMVWDLFAPIPPPPGTSINIQTPLDSQPTCTVHVYVLCLPSKNPGKYLITPLLKPVYVHIHVHEMLHKWSSGSWARGCQIDFPFLLQSD